MDATKELDLVENYLRFPLRFLSVFGLWRRNSNVFLYTFYSVFFLSSTQYFYALFQIIYMIIVWGDIEKIAEASFLLLTQVTLCVKIVFYVIKLKTIKDLINMIRSDIFAPTKEIHKKILVSHSKVQLFEFFLFLSMSSTTISLWAIFPMIDKESDEKFLPFKAWYPMAQNETPYYEILYFYQIVGIWFSACINISIDRLSTSMTSFGCAEVLVLHDNLLNIEKYAAEDVSNGENFDKESTIEDLEDENVKELQKKIEDRIEVRLLRCIEHHQAIVRFVAKIEECFHLGILAQFAASVGIICITGLQLTLVNPNSIRFLSKFLYLMAMMAQIFFICRIGDNISVVSGNLMNATYNSAWITRRKTYKKSLIIFMERLKQPIVTRAGYFFPLSLQTFMSILRSSYSYFAVLQQMNSKK